MTNHNTKENNLMGAGRIDVFAKPDLDRDDRIYISIATFDPHLCRADVAGRTLTLAGALTIDEAEHLADELLAAIGGIRRGETLDGSGPEPNAAWARTTREWEDAAAAGRGRCWRDTSGDC